MAQRFRLPPRHPRRLNKAEVDYLWRLNPGLGPAKSERHQRPGRMRHVRQPTREQSAYDGTAERLRTLQRGEPLDLPASDLPPWARAGMVCHWWTRAVVDADGVVELYDDGSVWLAENGLA